MVYVVMCKPRLVLLTWQCVVGMRRFCAACFGRVGEIVVQAMLYMYY
jgi:hypothetical protein